MEKVKGLEARIEVCKRLEESYGNGRRVDSERPLVKIDGSRAGDTAVTYDKGGWVFYMLHELMGRERNLDGIQAFFKQYARSNDHPVLQDFVESMRPFAPDTAAYDDFVKQWFFEVVVPEYKLDGAKCAKDGEGFSVTLSVENKGGGRMPVTIAAVTGDRFEERTDDEVRKRGPAPEKKDYRDARTTVTLGAKEKTEVTIRCDFEPKKVLVDPDAKMLMLRRKNAEAKL
jgi:aminopeptidase N